MECLLPQESSEALPLMCPLDEEVKQVGSVSDSNETGKLRTRVREKVPIPRRGQVLALGLH